MTDGDRGPELVVIPGTEVAKRFAIGRTEITIGELNAYCSKAGCDELAGDRGLPATNIPVKLAIAYSDWLSTQSDWKYRLPTVTEWRYAAKAANGLRSPEEKQELPANCGTDQLADAKSGRRNQWELFNVAGNAEEWATKGDELFALGDAHTSPRRATVQATPPRPIMRLHF